MKTCGKVKTGFLLIEYLIHKALMSGEIEEAIPQSVPNLLNNILAGDGNQCE